MASSSSETEQKKMLILKSSDEDEFEIEESIAVQSGTIKNMVEDDYTLIPLPNVDTKTLIKIIEYMKMHAEKKEGSNEEEFDKEFVKISFKEMSQLVYAANYLHIAGLMDLLCQTIADKIKNKSVNAVRQIFNITNDYTPEEEEKVRREHEWAHEGEYDDTVDDLIPVEEEAEEESDDNVRGGKKRDNTVDDENEAASEDEGDRV